MMMTITSPCHLVKHQQFTILMGNSESTASASHATAETATKSLHKLRKQKANTAWTPAELQAAWVNGGALWPLNNVYNTDTHYDETTNNNEEDGDNLPLSQSVSLPLEWDSLIVAKLIVEFRLAPFYRGYQSTSDLPTNSQEDITKEEVIDDEIRPRSNTLSRIKRTISGGLDSIRRHDSMPAGLNKRSTFMHSDTISTTPPLQAVLADLYSQTLECPICFLLVPSRLNYSRCCQQPICSECFVQIKRPSDGSPALCPFCIEPHFGVVFGQSKSREELKTCPSSPPMQNFSRLQSQSQNDLTHRNSILGGVNALSLSRPRRPTYIVQQSLPVSSDDIRPGLLDTIHARQQRARDLAQTASDTFSQFVRPFTRTTQSTRPTSIARRAQTGGMLALSGDGVRTMNAQDDPAYFVAMRDNTYDLEEIMMNEALRQSIIAEQERESRLRQAADAERRRSSLITSTSSTTSTSTSTTATATET